MTLDHLTKKALKDQADLRNAKIGLAKGTITQEEYDYFIKNGLHMEKQQEPSQETTTTYTEKPTLNEKRRRYEHSTGRCDKFDLRL